MQLRTILLETNYQRMTSFRKVIRVLAEYAVIIDFESILPADASENHVDSKTRWALTFALKQKWISPDPRVMISTTK